MLNEEEIQIKNNISIRNASDKKILRRQLELLAKYSYNGIQSDRIPEISESMVSIYRELVKAKCRAVVLRVVFFGGLLYTLYRIFIKLTKLFQR